MDDFGEGEGEWNSDEDRDKEGSVKVLEGNPCRELGFWKDGHGID